MKRIFSIFIVLGLIFASYGLSSAPKDVGNVSMDEIFKKKIVGKWAEGESPYGMSSFEEGGNYRAWIYENSKKEKLLYSMEGKWWIEKGKLYNSVSEITPPITGLKAGDIVVDKIVAISDTVMTLIDEEGQQYSSTKIREMSK